MKINTVHNSIEQWQNKTFMIFECVGFAKPKHDDLINESVKQKVES